jgi:transposase
VTQGRRHPDARSFLERRIASGNTPSEARRALKRRLSDLVYRDLLRDASIAAPHPSALAA